MLDRLRVADLKDEIVSMQAELNSVLFDQHQKSQMVIKTEVSPQVDTSNNFNHAQPTIAPRAQQTVPIMHEPSQILKAKQEQKLFEHIKNEREVCEAPKEQVKSSFNFALSSPSQKSANTSQPKQSKFDKLKNDTHHIMKPSTEMKEELDDFDIESEIRPNLIMKKCESVPLVPAPVHPIAKKTPKQREKPREFSPMSDYFNKKVPVKVKEVKNESQDGSYEWLSIHKELNLQLSGTSNKKELQSKEKTQPKSLENDLSEIFEHHTSPKSVEKQLDDLFSSTNKSGDLLNANSPLTEFFHVEATSLNEKTVENRLEALFGGAEDDSRKSSQQDLVETRLEQLFQGSVAENDESALDNASFLYKNTDMTYEMIQKQIQVSGDSAIASGSNKRQWNGDCDMFASTNASMMYPTSSSPPSKRVCTAAPVSFDNKWIEDSFDFATEIMSTESSGDDITKHSSWNGNIDHRETMISGIQSPHQSQFHDSTNLQQHSSNHNMQQTEHMNLMDTQMPNLNYDDVDDISRQVQNAIDSILNLQSSDPLTYQLDSSFLELNAITAPSGAPNSPINVQQTHAHQTANPQHHNQYQMHPRSDQMHVNHSFNNQKTVTMPKRKYSRMDDIGDCLIGGSNLDNSPSALALAEPHGGESSSASVGEFVNNLLNCEEKSITTS